MSERIDWQCINGYSHRCEQAEPGPQCPHCVSFRVRRLETERERLHREEQERAAARRDPRQTSLLP